MLAIVGTHSHRDRPRVPEPIDNGLVLANLAFAQMQDQITAFIDLKPVRAVEAKRNHRRVSAGRDHQVIFQLFVVAVIDQIDPGVNLRVTHPGKRGHGFLPAGGVAAEKIVHLAAKWLQTATCRVGVAARQAQANDPRNSRQGASARPELVTTRFVAGDRIVPQDQGCPIGAKADGLLRSPGDELDALVCLALVGFKVQRQLAKTRGGDGGRWREGRSLSERHGERQQDQAKSS